LGAIGGQAGMPVMEGKSVLFKEFGGADVMPLCWKTKDKNKCIELVSRVAPTFSAINLEDISGPDCFEIEETLKQRCKCVIFHDDQHGTAVVT